jgi:iron only hydrogenase large subunit-like protein
VIISVSPQSRASLAVRYKLTPSVVHRKLAFFFKSIGVSHTLDTAFSRDISLLESAREFVDRYKAKSGPMLSSACPGWICYAEKTHPNLISYISTTKSPQQVMGAIVKSYIPRKLAVKGIFHASVMPCFDKKLEASRDDFVVDGERDVDCVVGTAEIDGLLTEFGVDFVNCPMLELDLMYVVCILIVIGLQRAMVWNCRGAEGLGVVDILHIFYDTLLQSCLGYQ